MTEASYLNRQINEIKSMQEFIQNKIWIKSLEKSVLITKTAIKNGNKIFFAGNGGSAADAQHMSAEFVSRFEFDRVGLPGIALTVDTSILTSCANDYGYENIFKRQLATLGNKNDVIWLYTTSGNSKNIIEAAKQAKKMKIKVILFCGKNFESLKQYADNIVSIDSNRTPRIQEWHLISGHIICGTIEDTIFANPH